MAQVFNSHLRTGAGITNPTGSCAAGALPAVGGMTTVVGAPAVGACGSTGFARGVATTTASHNPMLTSTLRTSGVPTMGPIVSSQISDVRVGAIPSQHNITGSVIGGGHVHTSGIGGAFGSAGGLAGVGGAALGGAGLGGAGLHTHTTSVGLGPGVGGAFGAPHAHVATGPAPHAHVTTGPSGGFAGGVGGVAPSHTHTTTVTTTNPGVGAIGGVVDTGMGVPHTHLATSTAAPMGGMVTPGYVNNVGGGYYQTGNFCNRRCGGLPWWLWILLGLLLAGLIGGLSWFLKRSSGSSTTVVRNEGESSSSSSSSSSNNGNGGSSSQQTTTTVTEACEQGFFMYKDQCIQCPQGSKWNGRNCMKKEYKELSRKATGSKTTIPSLSEESETKTETRTEERPEGRTERTQTRSEGKHKIPVETEVTTTSRTFVKRGGHRRDDGEEGGFDTIRRSARNAGGAAFEAVGNVGGAAVEGLSSAGGAVARAGEGAWEGAGRALRTVGGAASDTIGSAGSALRSAGEGAWEGAGRAFRGAGELAGGAKDFLWSKAGQAGDAISGLARFPRGLEA